MAVITVVVAAAPAADMRAAAVQAVGIRVADIQAVVAAAVSLLARSSRLNDLAGSVVKAYPTERGRSRLIAALSEA